MVAITEQGTVVASTESLTPRSVIVGIGFGSIAATLAGAGWIVKAPAHRPSLESDDETAQELNAIVAMYGPPTDVDAFEHHYQSTHIPLGYSIPGVQDITFHTSMTSPDGEPSEHYRITTFRFADAAGLEAALMSEEGQATIADLARFATGGFTLLLAHVEALTEFPTGEKSSAA